VHNAVEQAKNAAATLLGRPEPYRLVPWYWSDQADLKLQMVGEVLPDDEPVPRGVMSDEAFSVLYYRGDELTGAQCVNRPVDFMAVRSALSRGLTVPASSASDITVPLKSLVTEMSDPVERSVP
jgi:3-phenylpropionate/trans-cinnamate dioxygenase ferredoxin reductase subunit